MPDYVTQKKERFKCEKKKLLAYEQTEWDYIKIWLYTYFFFFFFENQSKKNVKYYKKNENCKFLLELELKKKCVCTFP